MFVDDVEAQRQGKWAGVLSSTEASRPEPFIAVFEATISFAGSPTTSKNTSTMFRGIFWYCDIGLSQFGYLDVYMV